MSFISSISPLLFLGLVLPSLVLGFWLGSKRANKKRRRLQRDINQKNLEALELKSSVSKTSKYLAQSARKDRLLKMSLRKSSTLEKANKKLMAQLAKQEKQHFIEQSQLKLISTQANHQAQQALSVANRASRQVQLLESMIPTTQTIQAPPAKSYGQANTVQVKVVDQHPPSIQNDAVSRVSNRDSAMLAKLRSSNEERRSLSDNLQAIDSINPQIERKLNKAGVYRVEQLANMPDAELIKLANTVGIDPSDDFKAKWKGVAQELMRQN